MEVNSKMGRLWPSRLARQLLFVNLVLVPCLVTGQVEPTKVLTPADYPLWSTMNRVKASGDGKWISYGLEYESGADTLFLKQVETGKTIGFADAKKERFNGKQCFSFIDAKGDLIVKGLEGHNSFTVQGVQRYDYLKNGSLIAVLRIGSDQKKVLELRDNRGIVVKTVADADSFTASPLGNYMAYVTLANGKSSFGILDCSTGIAKTVLRQVDGGIVNFVWQENEAAVAFVVKGERAAVKLYQIASEKLYSFEPAKRKDWPAAMEITAFQREFLSISADGKRVCFTMEEKPVAGNQAEDSPQIWKTTDVYLYPIKAIDKVSQVGIWTPETDEFTAGGAKREAVSLIAGNARYVVTADIGPYVPTIKYDSDADLYLTDCNTKEKTLLLKEFAGESERVLAAPGGHFLTYFKEGHWYVYDLKAARHTNLTKALKTSFADSDYDIPGGVPPYAEPRWSKDNQHLYLCDRYDIWEFTPDGAKAKRLTQGKEKGLQLRFLSPLQQESNDAYFIRNAETVDLKRTVLLEAVSDDFSSCGYFSITGNGPEKEITLQQKSLKLFRKVKDSDTYAYVLQDSDAPPAIVLQQGKKVRTVFQSNAHFSKYGSSKSELIRYTDSHGKPLTGVLFYPFNYNPKLKYPMVVYLYQRLSMWQHLYLNPSLYDGEGFNRTNFTSQGYFVLCPDIAYQVGKPVFSARDCVLAATKSALKNASIEAQKLGLIGHSFGGYECSFIITQTDMFKAAVAGAAITDLPSSYLSLSKSYGRPSFWRFESYQSRMGKSLFEDWNNYLENSPTYHAGKTTTPLLSWSGNADNQVDASQSMAFFMALRRFGKSCTMLVYPGEGHALKKEANQADLSNKILNWFDHYLKGAPLLPQLQ